ncbi:MAG: phosphate signaling complex protein PhoU [Desulfovibrio sp.]|jgi:phosphate transport system protein|nr:phosphate signaling complex protein PhoU [Desulfovibrio sp.]
MSEKETQLQQCISRLRTRLLVMCATVGLALDDACAALETGNMGQAAAVVEGDAAVDALENETDEAVLTLLARHQPAAQDLRFLVAALRIVIDLERIGDESADIAVCALKLQAPLPRQAQDHITLLADAAAALYKKAVEAFRVGDIPSALDLCRSDAESTRLEVQALRGVMEYFSQNGSKIEKSCAEMQSILVCRALNRICRRAANIGEHTVFIVKGVNMKHSAHTADAPDELRGDTRQRI